MIFANVLRIGLAVNLVIGMCAATNAADYSGAVIRDLPVAYFRFEENSENQLWDSLSDEHARRSATTHSLNLFTEGPLLTRQGVRDYAARFTGASYLHATSDPDVYEFEQAVSIEFWIRPTQGGEATQCLIAKGEYTRTGCNYYVVYFQQPLGESGRLRFGIAEGHIDQTSQLMEKQFTHVVVTYDPAQSGDNTQMYINGKLDAAKRIDGKPRLTKGTSLSIGALYGELPKQPRTQFFVGDLDEVAFYKHVLPERRVAAHFAHATLPLVFENDVRPILHRVCLDCHADDPEGNLDLRTVTAMLRGGTNGPAIVRGQSGQSLLTERIEFDEMPPADSGLQLSEAERGVIEAWIDSGCQSESQVIEPSPFSWVSDQHREHWAFRQFAAEIMPPPVSEASAHVIRTPIDAFIQDRLEQHGLSMSSDADRMRLVRRLFVDLTGLPPTPKSVDYFLFDNRRDAYEQLVDRLLDTPQFGVRWGRHWLDIVGYTDTVSFDDDYGPPIGFVDGKWRYRDYVIRSLNQDKSWSRFITEQLAGDELVNWREAKKYTPEIVEALVATGYLRCCEDISKEDPRAFIIWSVLHDSVEQLGTSLLGLTLNCSRCHSHKFEPIPQRDYYRLMAVLTPALNPANWKDPQQRALPDVSPPILAEINEHNAKIEKQAKPFQDTVAAIFKRHETNLRNAKVASLPKPDQAPVMAALSAPLDQRDATQEALLEKYEEALTVDPKTVDAAITGQDRRQTEEANRRIAELNSQRREHGWIHAVYDVGSPPATRLFRRGSHLNPRREVPAGFLEVLSDKRGFDLQSAGDNHGMADRPPLSHHDSGYRLALARWLTDESSSASALVARVMVNRVWAHLLGEPIVETSNNLGVSGAKPSHPQLLDWLASDFRRHGSLKRLIRQIVTSSTYRQASFGSHGTAMRAREVDPNNRLLWRARLRRVEAEVVRDSILAVAGRLDSSMGGPPVPLEYHPNGTVRVAKQGLLTPSAAFRRSVYLLNRRIYNPSFLSVFDKPIVTGSVCHREVSAVALQSLSMLNDAFVVEQSRKLAARVATDAGPLPDARIKLLFRLTLAREPMPQERDLCRKMLAKEMDLHRTTGMDKSPELAALAGLCQTVLNMNEFLYLE